MAHIKGAMFPRTLLTEADVIEFCYPDLHKAQKADKGAAPPPPPTPAATPKSKAKKAKVEVDDSERTTLPAPEPATEPDPFKGV
jgi:hypothetical protein